MTKQEAYEKATMQNLSNPNGTRMDIIYLAMDIYAEAMKPENVWAKEKLKCAWCGSLAVYKQTGLCESCFTKGKEYF